MRYLRLIFALVIVWAGWAVLLAAPGPATYAVVATGALILLITLLLEARIRQGDARQVLAGGVGLILGIGLALLVLLVLSRLPLDVAEPGGGQAVATFLTVLLVLTCGYLGAVTGRAATADLTFFRAEEHRPGTGVRYLVGEKSLIDGRIVKLAESPLLAGEIVIPRFVVDQLNEMAASHVPVERFRGERGLDSMRRLQENRTRTVVIHEIDLIQGEIEGVLDYAVEHGARVVTHNPTMIKEAHRRAIPIVNLNEIAELLEPEVLSGDEIVIRLVKPGKEKDQAVGYLDNGNMVVVENARDDIGKTLRVAVTGLHQTRAGTLVFAKKRGETGDRPPGASDAQAAVEEAGRT